MSSPSVSKSIPSNNLSDDLVARYTREARKEGVFAGLASGLASAVLGARVLRLNRNMSLLSGVLSGVLAGFLFTQAFKTTNIARLEADLISETQTAGDSPMPGVLKLKDNRSDTTQ